MSHGPAEVALARQCHLQVLQIGCAQAVAQLCYRVVVSRVLPVRIVFAVVTVCDVVVVSPQPALQSQPTPPVQLARTAAAAACHCALKLHFAQLFPVA